MLSCRRVAINRMLTVQAVTEFMRLDMAQLMPRVGVHERARDVAGNVHCQAAFVRSAGPRDRAVIETPCRIGVATEERGEHIRESHHRELCIQPVRGGIGGRAVVGGPEEFAHRGIDPGHGINRPEPLFQFAHVGLGKNVAAGDIRVGHADKFHRKRGHGREVNDHRAVAGRAASVRLGRFAVHHDAVRPFEPEFDLSVEPCLRQHEIQSGIEVGASEHIRGVVGAHRQAPARFVHGRQW